MLAESVGHQFAVSSSKPGGAKHAHDQLAVLQGDQGRHERSSATAFRLQDGKSIVPGSSTSPSERCGCSRRLWEMLLKDWIGLSLSPLARGGSPSFD